MTNNYKKMLLKQNTKINKIKKMVGKPYFESKNIILYNMDCIEFMKKIKKPIFDLIITSPPYNIGKEYEQKMEINDYINWSEIWLNKVYDITKKNGGFWLNLGYFAIPQKGCAVPISYMIWNKSPFYFMQEIIWHYGAGVYSNKMFSPRNEKFLWYIKNPKKYTFNLDAVRDKNVKYPNQKKNGILRVNPNGKNPTNVWTIPKVTSGGIRASKERTPHPAQFPLKVIDRIVKACSNENDLIFDPFIGSGTVAEAALQNNRVVIGCDIKKKYLDIAKKRIEKIEEK